MTSDVNSDGIGGATRGAVLNAFHKIRRIHLVGIGGAGVSGIAEVLHGLGFQISGSDMRLSAVTERLSSLGIRVCEGHDAANIGDAQVVVYSSAVKKDNPELVAAVQANVPVIERSEMLGELTRLGFCVGVAGSHGKTTTTSMVGHILKVAGMDPTIIVGGRAESLGTGGVLGSGRLLVVEADEYARTFLKMFPTLAVVTTLDAEHLDIYDGLEDLTSAFLTYLSRVPFYGMNILSADDPNVRALVPHLTRPLLTFGPLGLRRYSGRGRTPGGLHRLVHGSPRRGKRLGPSPCARRASTTCATHWPPLPWRWSWTFRSTSSSVGWRVSRVWTDAFSSVASWTA